MNFSVQADLNMGIQITGRDQMTGEDIAKLNALFAAVEGLGGVINYPQDGSQGGDLPVGWTFTNATYADDTATWDGVGTVEFDGVGAISGYQVDIPSGLDSLDITVPNIPDAPCIFKVEAIGDGSNTSTFDIFSIQSDTGSKQVECFNNNVDATATMTINISDDNGAMRIILKDSEGVEIHNQTLSIPESALMPIRITSLFMNPSDAYITEVNEGE